MVKETEFIGCENLPDAMAGCFDRPWAFVGEVYTNRRWVECLCKKCNKREFGFKQEVAVSCSPITSVDLAGHLFVTDDRIEVMVYFGVCRECGSVYWARSGPPFRRARACVPCEA